MIWEERDLMHSIQSKLEAYIDAYLDLWDYYGVIQVIHKGEVLMKKAYGYASITSFIVAHLRVV